MTELLPTNGIDATTGLPMPAIEDREIADRAGDLVRPLLHPAELRQLRWWVERFGVNDPKRTPVSVVDPSRLASAGWGVLFAPDSQEERRALEPLLRQRREQAGAFYQEHVIVPGQSKLDFLRARGAPPGPADPSRLPYYLLIVGDPESIPFDFQLGLDIQYAVGRIWFDQPEDYARYAESVIRAETASPDRPRRITFFGTSNDDDPATHRSRQELVEPLVRRLATSASDWEVRAFLGPEATKRNLGRLLGGGETPAVLFTMTHGVSFPADDPDLRSYSGALVCQDWPGPAVWRTHISGDHFFSADDLAPTADLQGLVTFHFASFGGGMPELDRVPEDQVLRRPAHLAGSPFIARLPQRLLSHPNGGALAVIAPIDRLWLSSFGGAGGLARVFELVLRKLLQGDSIGSAMEYVNQRHAELAVELTYLWNEARSLSLSREQFARHWRLFNDVRSFIVLGDPAVRLAAFSRLG